VAMSESVHTARWIRQLDGLGYEIHLFPSVPSSRLHPLLHGKVVFHPQVSASCSGPGSRGLPGPHPQAAAAANLLIDKFFPQHHQNRLVALIKKLKPDLVHSLELQAAGYLSLEAKQRLGSRFPRWLVSNWGSDVYLFGQLPEHRRRLRALLEQCDYYLCECQRDIALARSLGLGDQPSAVIPGGGGMPLGKLAAWRAQPPSRRKRILLKGYQGWAGRALCGLRAVELMADCLQDFELVLYLATAEVELKARLLAESSGLKVRLVPAASHDTMLQLHGQARVSLGLSISDGASTSFLEALAMGSFPVQSHTACADEWVVDGVTGLLVPPEDPQLIAQALQRAVQDDELVDSAARLNQQVVEERLEANLVRARVAALYQSMEPTTPPFGK
jgi:glycosyltransferase involved in cell wall biosynthesis